MPQGVQPDTFPPTLNVDPQLAIVAQSMPAGTIFSIRFLPGSTTRPTFDMPYTLMTRAHPIMPLFVRPVGPLQQGQPLVWDMKVHEAPVVRSRGALDLRKGDQLFLRWDNQQWVYNLQALNAARGARKLQHGHPGQPSRRRPTTTTSTTTTTA